MSLASPRASVSPRYLFDNYFCAPPRFMHFRGAAVDKRVHNHSRGWRPLAERYTRSEVGRILGVSPRQLDYWARLRLVRPVSRWGERFYDFADLVALETIKRLTGWRVPARRLRRAIAVLERELGASRVPLQSLHVQASGRQVAVIPPGSDGHPIEPLTGQLLLRFDTSTIALKVHRMVSRTAEEWYELALACDCQPETLNQAVEAYRHVVEFAPDWLAPHINLGVALYQLAQLDEAHRCFSAALAIDPKSATAHFNLGCVLDEQGDFDEAIEHLRQALRLSPSLADAHFNLALALEKRQDRRGAREHWSLYLQCSPNGPWADYARSRISPPHPRRRLPDPIPIRRGASAGDSEPR
jgi:tetratricopeptide (TPR) repeat protein